ncbi:MAG: hypothetical protein ACOYN0_00745, partial [Phycisphaerales bacterium]
MRSVQQVAAVAAIALAGMACAQQSGLLPRTTGMLREEEVLVVYDSRIPDSRDVAEYYAGSAVVPGGAGGLRGARAGVRVFDLATSGAAVTTPGNITPANFVSRIRNPLRSHLTATGLATQVRCLV